MMHFLIGFAIAVAVGLTGIGGGSFTVPALVLIAGLPASEAVGTAFVFAGAIRLVAAPFYMLVTSSAASCRTTRWRLWPKPAASDCGWLSHTIGSTS